MYRRLATGLSRGAQAQRTLVRAPTPLSGAFDGGEYNKVVWVPPRGRRRMTETAVPSDALSRRSEGVSEVRGAVWDKTTGELHSVEKTLQKCADALLPPRVRGLPLVLWSRGHTCRPLAHKGTCPRRSWRRSTVCCLG